MKSSAVSGSLILLKSKAMQRHRNTQDVDLSQSSVSVAPTSLSIDSVVGFESSVPQKDSSLNDNLDTNSADNLASHTCPSCGRSFAVEPYNKHIKICKKVFFQKRKTFDSSKMRINAIPELKSNQIKVGSSSNTLENKKNNSKWRDQSNAFRQAMRSARSGNQTSSNSAVQNVYSPDPSLIQCPHCERRFNQQAAERHIPQCQNIIAKPSSLRKGAGSGGGVGPSFAKSSLIVRKGWQ